MNLENFYQFCLSKNGVTEHFPFDEDTLVLKIGGKIFALTSLSDWENENPTVNLKCNSEKALELRAEFEDIRPGYHMNKIHWNTININKSVSDKMINELINHSYELIFNSLPKKSQQEILEIT
jgi:predicted DNA-binding protein (MmcQ/YjbR family)